MQNPATAEPHEVGCPSDASTTLDMPPMRPPLTVLNGLKYAQLSRRYACLYGHTFKRSCSCSAPQAAPNSAKSSSKARAPKQKTMSSDPPFPPTDHRALGQNQDLFISSPYSPGSPLFLPNGAHIFQKLQSFLRTQYAQFGYQEVLTPTIYKKSLWEVSGHWENYAENMYSVVAPSHGAKAENENPEAEEVDDFAIKSMNCPGHCLLFAHSKQTYRNLPIRYADFSALHRNEVSGSLSGLTRVRRFHQDDAHIFCRPSQIQDEIMQTLRFVKMVYNTLDLGPYKLLLSTRPEDHYIGTVEEWETAESQLKAALDASGQEWALNEGDGAFYGPKIDIVLSDSNGKEHQTATIQLDFQLPRRFKLQYQASPEEIESMKNEEKRSDDSLDEGHMRPVIIHRAIYGSLERFMALLIEKYAGVYPFWLSPRQAIILSLNQKPEVLDYVSEVQQMLALGPDTTRGFHIRANPLPPQTLCLNIDTDTSARSLGKKMKEAIEKQYNHIIIIGSKEVEEEDIRLKISSQPEAGDAEFLLDRYTDQQGKDGSYSMAPDVARQYMEELVRSYQ